MIKILAQPAVEIIGYDFNCLYLPSGNMNINYTLISSDGKNLQGQIKVDKEFTDNWTGTDQPIIDAIAQETGLNLQPIQDEPIN